MRQFSASPMRMVASIAALLATGRLPGQAQADRADLGVGLGAELGRAAAEHLRPGAELDVGLQPDHRLVAGDRVVVGQQGHGAHRCSRSAEWSSDPTSLVGRRATARPGIAGPASHHGLNHTCVISSTAGTPPSRRGDDHAPDLPEDASGSARCGSTSPRTASRPGASRSAGSPGTRGPAPTASTCPAPRPGPASPTATPTLLRRARLGDR